MAAAVFVLVALGAAGFSVVSDRMAGAFAIPVARRCRRRGTVPCMGNSYLAITAADTPSTGPPLKRSCWKSYGDSGIRYAELLNS